jgi:iron-sulfur cluster repair protein YtfE (RIC family)
MDKGAWRSDPLIRLIRDQETVSEYVENLETMLDSFDTRSLVAYVTRCATYDAEAREKLKPIEAFFRQNVMAHFAFEEKTVFPALRQAIGTPDVRRLLDDLVQEHASMRLLVTEFIRTARDSASAEDKEIRRKLYGIAHKIVDKLQLHASKEDERLLPLIRKNLAFFKPAIETPTCRSEPLGSSRRRK